MKAFGVLYRLGYESAASCASGRVHVCAASDGENMAAILCNNDRQTVELSIRIDDLKRGKKIDCYLLDVTHDLQKVREYDVPRFDISMAGTTLILLQSR